MHVSDRLFFMHNDFRSDFVSALYAYRYFPGTMSLPRNSAGEAWIPEPALNTRAEDSDPLDPIFLFKAIRIKHIYPVFVLLDTREAAKKTFLVARPFN